MTGQALIVQGDALRLPLPDRSVDAIVTDPPYALPGGFMGKTWDNHDGREDAGFCYWLTGLIDGEGCFTVKRHSRGTYSTTFAIRMRTDELPILERIQRTLRIGTFVHQPDHQPNPTVSWVVQDKVGCQKLVDLLDKYPLRAKKRMDYAVWRDAVCEWTNRPRGNRWHGPADTARMAELKSEMERIRTYVEPSWSGNRYQDWCRLWATEALRVLKPGGWLLAFGGTRTWHRLACGIEDAGFEMRDTIAEFSPGGDAAEASYGPLAWVYGSGFPLSKSLDVGKAIDKRRQDNPDWQRVGAWLKLQRETAGYTRQSLAPLLVGHKNLDSAAANISNWENGLSFPTWERWEELRRLLAFGPEMDAEVWRLNGRKGTPGEAWERRKVLEVIPDRWAGKGAVFQRATQAERDEAQITAPATPEAERWQGWGTALKPSWEPVIVARKPLSGTVAQNVLEYGTGALNIDASRISSSVLDSERRTSPRSGERPSGFAMAGNDGGERHNPEGRWPPNVALIHSEGCQPTGTRKIRGTKGIRGRNALGFINDDGWQPKEEGQPVGYADADGMEEVIAWTCEENCPVFLLDQQSGTLHSQDPRTRQSGKVTGGQMFNLPGMSACYADQGGASRFMYTAKAGPNERVTIDGDSHPTVKPLALMRWLVRLITPPGGTVLDMFAGSGTTGEAAMLEGFRCVLIDKDPTNLPSIRVRTHPYVRRTKIITNGQRTSPEQGSLL